MEPTPSLDIFPAHALKPNSAITLSIRLLFDEDVVKWQSRDLK